MVGLTYTTAMLAAVSMKCVGAFIQSSGTGLCIHKHHTGPRNDLVPSLHYSPSSDESAREEEILSPYDDLFRAHLQQEQHGIAKKDQGPQHKSKHVHIILFNQGLEEEGVHCIEYPRNSGSNVILAFESYKDCKRFAKNLGSQSDSDPAPQTQKVPRRNLSQYANDLGIAVQVIPAGMNLKPPDQNYGGGLDSSRVDQLPLLIKLKEQKSYLDRLIGASPSSSSGSAADIEGLPAWG